MPWLNFTPSRSSRFRGRFIPTHLAGSGKMKEEIWLYNSTLDHISQYFVVVSRESCVIFKRLSLVYQGGVSFYYWYTIWIII